MPCRARLLSVFVDATYANCSAPDFDRNMRGQALTLVAANHVVVGSYNRWLPSSHMNWNQDTMLSNRIFWYG